MLKYLTEHLNSWLVREVGGQMLNINQFTFAPTTNQPIQTEEVNQYGKHGIIFRQKQNLKEPQAF